MLFVNAISDVKHNQFKNVGIAYKCFNLFASYVTIYKQKWETPRCLFYDCYALLCTAAHILVQFISASLKASISSWWSGPSNSLHRWTVIWKSNESESPWRMRTSKKILNFLVSLQVINLKVKIAQWAGFWSYGPSVMGPTVEKVG